MTLHPKIMRKECPKSTCLVTSYYGGQQRVFQENLVRQ